jgi:hypothetical protein
MLEKFPNMREEQYVYQGSDHDQLFVATYLYQRGGTCQECDPREVVKRVARQNLQPKIHLGTIGSGNTVSKTGQPGTA